MRPAGCEAMQVEHVGRVRGQRALIPDRADDDERVDLEPGGMRASDEVEKRIEAFGDGDVLRQRFAGVEIPGIAAPANLDEERIGVSLLGTGDDRRRVVGGVEARVEGVNPEAAEL